MQYTQQELNDILQWKTEIWKIPLLYWDKNIEWNTINTCLEIGAREGGLSLWFAKHNKTTYCSDIVNPINTAKPIHDKYDYAKNKIYYIELDATQTFSQKYDIIATKSVLGGIGRKNKFSLIEKTIKNIYNSLNPNGYYLFAENARATIIHKFFRNKINSWAKEWYYLNRRELLSALKIYPKFKIYSFGFFSPFYCNNFTARMDKIIHPIVPSSWEYIIYGIAQKA